MSIDLDKYKITDPDRIKKIESQNVDHGNFDQYRISDPERIKKIEEKNNEPKKSFSQLYQDFMSPSELKTGGQPVNETIIGRLPKEIPELKSGTEENKELIKDLINSAALSPGIKSIVEAPFKLSLKNIAKKLVGEKNAQYLYHANEYNKIWQEGKSLGLDNVNINPKKIGLDILRKNKVNDKYIRPLEELIKNPTLENSQKAQSDLGKLLNSPQLTKDVLTSEENAIKKIASSAQEHIKDMMFRDKTGKLNQSLKKSYDAVSKSYGENYKPYDIKAIKKYEKGKLTARQLMQKIKSGEFMAQKGAAHPEIGRREHAIETLKYLGIPTGIGLGLEGGKYLMDKLLGK